MAHFLVLWRRLPASDRDRTHAAEALLDALAAILWTAGSGEAKLAVSPPGSVSDCRRSLKAFKIITCRSQSSLREAISAHASAYLTPMGAGVVLLVYSALMTRGLSNVAADLDDQGGAPSMIGRHHYATQELVNLLLYGRANSNVFDKNKNLDGLVLKGVQERSLVGLLTLFEHYGSMEVGSYLKSPREPVWVVCAESHYSVLFARGPADPTDATRVVDLVYYDPLGRQTEEYHLTVRPGKAPGGADDMEGMIDLTLRTKWKNADVDWNGSEKIL